MYLEPASLVMSCQLVDKREIGGEIFNKTGEPVVITFSFPVVSVHMNEPKLSRFRNSCFALLLG